MGYKKDEIRKIQIIELDILHELKRICDSNNIEYFIIGGTALGAKRHGGFIPWDDDIDIGMTRHNYNKFISIAQEKLGNGFFLQTPMTDRNSPFPYAKVRKDDTEFIEWCNRSISMHKGIYIDVFPYDKIPDNENARKKQFKNVQRLSRLYVLKKTPDVSEKPIKFIDYIRASLRRMIYLILKLIPSKLILVNLERHMCKYNDQKTAMKACLLFPQYMVECMENNVLYPLQTINFENIAVPAPNNLDKYLTTHYGDYMELPPVDKRVGHRPYIVEFE